MAEKDKTIFSRFLDLDGDGTGTKNLNQNYSVTGDIAYIKPPANKTMYIQRLLVSLGDTNGMQAQEYGNLGGALTNGITFKQYQNGNLRTDFTDGIPVKTNSLLGTYCYDVDVKSWGAGNELLVARWTFTNSGAFVCLNGATNDTLEVSLDDDFTGLLEHYFLVQGYYG